MTKQIIFIIILLLTLGVFAYTATKIILLFKLTKPFPIRDFPKRFLLMLKVAIGQTKIFRFPLV